MPYRYAKRADRLHSSAIRDILQVVNKPGMISFAGGLPAAELFPTEHIARAAAGLLSGPQAAQSLQYAETEGHLGLRTWVASRTPLAGLNPLNVLITQGSQQGLDLIAKLFIDPGDEVLVESPAYLGALQVFRFFGAKVTFLPCDEGGIIADSLWDALARKPKLLYMTPTFQNPSGLCYDADRRQIIRDALRPSETLLVEDDAYRELWYDAPPPPPVSVGLPADQFIYLGSFSKTTVPGLRIGFLISSMALVRKCTQAKQATDLQTNTFGQYLLHELVIDPAYHRHLQLLRSEYAIRRDAMDTEFTAALSSELSWRKPAGGMFFWARLKSGADAAVLLKLALEEGLAFVPGGEFHAPGEGRDTMRLNFTHANPDSIHEGAARLTRAIGRMGT